jgi:hypothetical protein
MLIVPETILLDIQQALVNATHSIVNQDGEHVMTGTIDPRRLEMAALCAVQSAVGEVVWPSNKRIDWPRPRHSPGPFATGER